MTKFNRYVEAHDPTKHNGPGDGRTTALQIIEDNDLQGKWSDKVVLITGCSSGIGIETARALTATGAKVYVTVRNMQKGQEALKDILEPGRSEILELRLDSLTSVRACAAAFQEKEPKLNVLINNAGVMALQERTETEDGFETQIGTNHFGHFLLFQLLKPQLLAASTPDFHSRVVNLSSSGHTAQRTDLDDINLAQPGAYSPWAGYGNSKTANIWMANEIERRYGSGNASAMKSGAAIHGHSLHPGGIVTGLQVHADLGPLMERPDIKIHMKSPAQGAATTVWAAVAPEWEGAGGKWLEDVQIMGARDPNVSFMQRGSGHAEWAFDEEAATKLWQISNASVGIQDA